MSKVLKKSKINKVVVDPIQDIVIIEVEPKPNDKPKKEFNPTFKINIEMAR